MLGIALIAAVASLPGYALGQPLDDARMVVPAGRTAETWRLHCNEESAAGTRRCWTAEVVDGHERPAAPQAHGSDHSTATFEFLHDRLVRIRIVYFADPSDKTGKILVWSLPNAPSIDDHP